MKRFGWFFLSAIVLSPHLSGQQTSPLSLDDAIALALSQGPERSVAAANAQAAQSVHKQNVAKAALNVSSSVSYTATSGFGDNALSIKLGGGVLPSNLSSNSSEAPFLIPQNVQASVTASVPLTKATVSATQTLQANPDSSWSSTSLLGLSLTQTLWDGYPGGALSAALDKSELTLQTNVLNQETIRLALIAKVKQAFYTLFAAQENVALLERTLDQRRSFLAILTAKRELKQASEIDYKTAIVNVKTAEVDLKAARIAQQTARSRLSSMLGYDSNFDLRIQGVEDPVLPTHSWEEALKIAMDKRTDLKVLELSIRSNRIDEKLFKGQGQPNVALTSSVNYLADWNSKKSAESLSFGLKIGLPVFDSGLVQHQSEASERSRDAANAQYEQLKTSIEIDLRDAFEQYAVKLDRWEIARLNVETLQAQSDVLHVQNEFGTAKNSDVMTADVNLSAGQYASLQARINVWLAAIALLNVMGM